MQKIKRSVNFILLEKIPELKYLANSANTNYRAKRITPKPRFRLLVEYLQFEFIVVVKKTFRFSYVFFYNRNVLFLL
jgi:hypothetical protein